MKARLGVALPILLLAVLVATTGASSAASTHPTNGTSNRLNATAPAFGTHIATWQPNGAANTLSQCANPYIVRSGETLYSIAARCRTSAVSIKQANRLNSDRVRAGQRLIIPSIPANPPQPRPKPVYPTPQP